MIPAVGERVPENSSAGGAMKPDADDRSVDMAVRRDDIIFPQETKSAPAASAIKAAARNFLVPSGRE